MADVINNEAENRYELAVDDAVAYAAYERQGVGLAFTHTIVPPELEGQGIGSRLVKGALDDVAAQGLKVIPECSFVRHFIETHDDYRRLVIGQ